MHVDPEPPLRMVIDELDSLQKLPSLEDSLTKGRKHGLRIVAGIQSTAQLERTLAAFGDAGRATGLVG